MDKYSIDFVSNTNLSDSDKFNKFIDIISDTNNKYINSHHEYYIYMQSLSEEQIYEISKLKVNKYLFFKYLPNIQLINKYYTKDSNKFQGVLNNTNITKDERNYFINNNLTN